MVSSSGSRPFKHYHRSKGIGISCQNIWLDFTVRNSAFVIETFDLEVNFPQLSGKTWYLVTLKSSLVSLYRDEDRQNLRQSDPKYDKRNMVWLWPHCTLFLAFWKISYFDGSFLKTWTFKVKIKLIYCYSETKKISFSTNECWKIAKIRYFSKKPENFPFIEFRWPVTVIGRNNNLIRTIR